MYGRAVVGGVGESTDYKHGQAPDTEFQLACTAIERACADAGIDVAEVDGLISYMDTRNSPLRVAAALGMKELRWSSTPWAGGGNNSASCVMQADAAVSAGDALRALPSTAPSPALRVETFQRAMDPHRLEAAKLELEAERGPSDADSLRALGLFLRDTGERERSNEMLRRYLESRPDAFDRRLIEGYLDRTDN